MGPDLAKVQVSPGTEMILLWGGTGGYRLPGWGCGNRGIRLGYETGMRTGGMTWRCGMGHEIGVQDGGAGWGYGMGISNGVRDRGSSLWRLPESDTYRPRYKAFTLWVTISASCFLGFDLQRNRLSVPCFASYWLVTDRRLSSANSGNSL